MFNPIEQLRALLHTDELQRPARVFIHIVESNLDTIDSTKLTDFHFDIYLEAFHLSRHYPLFRLSFATLTGTDDVVFLDLLDNLYYLPSIEAISNVGHLWHNIPTDHPAYRGDILEIEPDYYDEVIKYILTSPRYTDLLKNLSMYTGEIDV